MSDPSFLSFAQQQFDAMSAGLGPDWRRASVNLQREARAAMQAQQEAEFVQASLLHIYSTPRMRAQKLSLRQLLQAVLEKTQLRQRLKQTALRLKASSALSQISLLIKTPPIIACAQEPASSSFIQRLFAWLTIDMEERLQTLCGSKPYFPAAP